MYVFIKKSFKKERKMQLYCKKIGFLILNSYIKSFKKIYNTFANSHLLLWLFAFL